MAHLFQTLEAELCAFWMFFFINCIFQIQILQIFSKYFSKLEQFTSKSIFIILEHCLFIPIEFFPMAIFREIKFQTKYVIRFHLIMTSCPTILIPPCDSLIGGDKGNRDKDRGVTTKEAIQGYIIFQISKRFLKQI